MKPSYFILLIMLMFLLIFYGRDTQRYVVNAVEGKTPVTGGDQRNYYVLANKPNKEKAAEITEKTNAFIIDFISRLKQKYLYNEKTCMVEKPISPADEFVPFSTTCAISDPLSDYRMRAVYLLVTRYRPNWLEENQPTSEKDTSWEEGKGERIALCLREQNTGQYNFIDPELVKFVAIHELTHIAANTLNHPYYFWKVFKFLVIEANNLMDFKLVDYGALGVNYCGMNVTYNPVFDQYLNVGRNEPQDITAVN